MPGTAGGIWRAKSCNWAVMAARAGSTTRARVSDNIRPLNSSACFGFMTDKVASRNFTRFAGQCRPLASQFRRIARSGAARFAAAGASVIMNNESASGETCISLQRSEEHTSELQSLMRISYAVFCLQKKKTNKQDAR